MPATTTKAPAPAPTQTSPQTGDTTNLLVSVVLLATMLGVIVVTSKVRMHG